MLAAAPPSVALSSPAVAPAPVAIAPAAAPAAAAAPAKVRKPRKTAAQKAAEAAQLSLSAPAPLADPLAAAGAAAAAAAGTGKKPRAPAKPRAPRAKKAPAAGGATTTKGTGRGGKKSDEDPYLHVPNVPIPATMNVQRMYLSEEKAAHAAAGKKWTEADTKRATEEVKTLPAARLAAIQSRVDAANAALTQRIMTRSSYSPSASISQYWVNTRFESYEKLNNEKKEGKLPAGRAFINGILHYFKSLPDEDKYAVVMEYADYRRDWLKRRRLAFADTQKAAADAAAKAFQQHAAATR